MVAQRMYGLMYGHVRLIVETPDNVAQVTVHNSVQRPYTDVRTVWGSIRTPKPYIRPVYRLPSDIPSVTEFMDEVLASEGFADIVQVGVALGADPSRLGFGVPVFGH